MFWSECGHSTAAARDMQRSMSFSRIAVWGAAYLGSAILALGQGPSPTAADSADALRMQVEQLRTVVSAMNDQLAGMRQESQELRRELRSVREELKMVRTPPAAVANNRAPGQNESLAEGVAALE